MEAEVWAIGAGNSACGDDDREVRPGDERGKEALSWGAGVPWVKGGADRRSASTPLSMLSS